MKRLMQLIVAITLILTIAWGASAEWAMTSGQQTADAAVSSSGCYLSAIQIETDGSNNVTVLLYDNASAASGTVVADITVVAGDYYGGRVWIHPIRCYNGIYADVTGTNGTYFVEYIQK